PRSTPFPYTTLFRSIGSYLCSREDAPGILENHMDSLPRSVREPRRLPLGLFRGLRFGVALHPHIGPDVYLEGAALRQSGFLRERSEEHTSELQSRFD